MLFLYKKMLDFAINGVNYIGIESSSKRYSATTDIDMMIVVDRACTKDRTNTCH